MRRTLSLTCLIFLGAILAFTAGCNSSSAPVTPGSSTNIVTGAGSTFLNPIMGRGISEFQGSHPGTAINYQSIGSGGGIQQMKKDLIDFGASDAALDDDQLKEMPQLVQIPESAGPVCITYNLADLKSPLKLSGDTLAGIFLGKIKSWQDSAIKQDNPGAALPNSEIVVAHRSDGSGTSSIFTTFLDKVSPEWHRQVGKGISVKWPAGIGGKGSEGVTGVVRQSAGSIGYVELSYAKENNLPVALVKNRAGNWTEPTAAATTAAIQAFEQDLAKDVRAPIVDPPASAKDGYPICGLTYLLIPKTAKDPSKGKIVKDFVQYIVTTGQNSAESLSYAKLPSGLAEQDQKLLGDVSARSPRAPVPIVAAAVQP